MSEIIGYFIQGMLAVIVFFISLASAIIVPVWLAMQIHELLFGWG